MSEAPPKSPIAAGSTAIPPAAPSVTPPGPPHSPLGAYTSARVSLQQTGFSLVTKEILQLQLASAQARDAVHAKLDVSAIVAGLQQRSRSHLVLASAAASRLEYFRNPSLGRDLSATSETALKNFSGRESPAGAPFDVVFVIADGLSALAVDRHALPLLDATLAQLDPAWTIAPICIVEQARVAVGDPIGEILGAGISVILIGERPGLSSPDSLGVYLTWNPRPGRTDAERNCISNIRPEGLGYAEAATLLLFYLRESRKLGHSGTRLKPSAAPPHLL